MGNLSGLTVGQGAPRPLPLPNSTSAGSATQIGRNKYAVREGYIGEGACLCGSKVLAPPLWVVFLHTSFGQAKEVCPRREGNFSAEDDCQRRSGVKVNCPKGKRSWPGPLAALRTSQKRIAMSALWGLPDVSYKAHRVHNKDSVDR